MRQTRKILAVLLAMVMAMSVLCMSAFAAEKKQYTVYTFFGDSVTAGVGLASYNAFFEQGTTAENRRVPGTYADIVAAEVGINDGETNYYNESHSGWRTSEVREILDPTYVNDDGAFAKAIADSMQIHKKDENYEAPTVEQLRETITDEIAKSDLITLDIGSNDVQLSLFMALAKGLYPSEANGYTPWRLEALLNEYGSTSEAIKSLSETIAKIHGVEFLLEVVLQSTVESLHKFNTNYPVIIDKIQEINPTADIYVIGLYNPMSSAVISESIPLQVGKIIDPLILSMNLYLSQLNPARGHYTYVDAFNTEVIDTVNFGDILSTSGGFDWTGMARYTIAVHPNEAGHQYIANQVLKAIPNKPAVLNGLVKGEDGLWAMYKNNKVQNVTGVFQNEKGWWRVKDGYVDFEANGIYQNAFGWWKTTNGRVTFDETGIFSNENGKWYVKNSKVDFTKYGRVKYDGKYYYVMGGKVLA